MPNITTTVHTNNFRPGDIVCYRGEIDTRERVIGEEEWLKFFDCNSIWKPDKVYTVRLKDNHYLGYCKPYNFTLIKSNRDIIFKEAL